jgi:hypothetical protein
LPVPDVAGGCAAIGFVVGSTAGKVDASDVTVCTVVGVAVVAGVAVMGAAVTTGVVTTGVIAAGVIPKSIDALAALTTNVGDSIADPT